MLTAHVAGGYLIGQHTDLDDEEFEANSTKEECCKDAFFTGRLLHLVKKLLQPGFPIPWNPSSPSWQSRARYISGVPDGIPASCSRTYWRQDAKFRSACPA